jgi:uncharacterized ferritin-like protein (DUF455 family)
MEETVQSFCRRVLESGELGAKLAAPGELRDAPGEPIEIERPARGDEIALTNGAGRLPPPGALGDASARAVCLARLAHHELMAVELFAWALLRWPELPAGLRRGWLRVLREEQEHCQLYLERLHAHGSTLADHDLSDYFWKHAPAIASSPAGPRAFLAAMGLTLEQANLDFSLTYRDGFRTGGDEASALVCQRVHDEEIAHVKLAAVWLARLAPRAVDEITAYRDAVPFPLDAHRAKGRRFSVEARRQAGLGDAFIEHVRGARPRRHTPSA